MRLIDADALKEKAWDADTRCGYVQVVDVGDIDNAPTIESQQTCEYWDSESKFCALCRPSTQPQRKTGHWILHPEQEKNIFGVKQIECSECGDKCLVQFVEKEKYCRNCGAKMEETE